MRELEELRLELDRVDREIVGLFEIRMALSREVAAYKQAHGLPVLDAAREARVLSSRVEMLQDKALAGAVQALYREMMALSRAQQQTMMEGGADA